MAFQPKQEGFAFRQFFAVVGGDNDLDLLSQDNQDLKTPITLPDYQQIRPQGQLLMPTVPYPYLAQILQRCWFRPVV